MSADISLNKGKLNDIPLKSEWMDPAPGQSASSLSASSLALPVFSKSPNTTTPHPSLSELLSENPILKKWKAFIKTELPLTTAENESERLQQLAANKIYLWFKKAKVQRKSRKSVAPLNQILSRSPQEVVENSVRTLQALCKSILAQKQRQEKNKHKKLQETIQSIKSTDLVEDGYGEFLFIRKDAAPVSLEEYEEVFPLFLEHHPILWARNPGSSGKRLSSLREKIEQVNPLFQAVFIPRVLYELRTIRLCMEEVLEQSSASSSSVSTTPAQLSLKTQIEELTKARAENPYTFSWKSSPSFIQLAFSINECWRKAFFSLCPGKASFSFGALQELAAEDLSFLEAVGKEDSPLAAKLSATSRKWFERFFSKKAFCFGSELGRKTVENALSLESIPGHVVLYRGSKFELDSPLDTSGGGVSVRSISYGAGLFSGWLNDTSATPWFYMNSINSSLTAQALLLDRDALKKDIFFIPSEHALTNIFGMGEYFHARTKVPVPSTFPLPILGVSGVRRYSSLSHHFLLSKLSLKSLLAQFKTLKELSFFLN